MTTCKKTKICVSSKTREGCNIEKPATDEFFGVSSTNKRLGKVYLKSLCRKCESSTKKINKPITTEAQLYNKVASMRW